MKISKYWAYEPLRILITYTYINGVVLSSSENKQNWKNGKV